MSVYDFGKFMEKFSQRALLVGKEISHMNFKCVLWGGYDLGLEIH